MCASKSTLLPAGVIGFALAPFIGLSRRRRRGADWRLCMTRPCRPTADALHLQHALVAAVLRRLRVLI